MLNNLEETLLRKKTVHHPDVERKGHNNVDHKRKRATKEDGKVQGVCIGKRRLLGAQRSVNNVRDPRECCELDQKGNRPENGVRPGPERQATGVIRLEWEMC